MSDTPKSFPSALEAIAHQRGDAHALRRGADAESEDDPPIVKLVNRMVEDAYARSATEVHVDPRPKHGVFAYLEKGVATERMRIPLRAHPNVVNRLKIMAGLSPFSGHAKGRIDFGRFSGRGLDVTLAVEFLPLPSGERAVVRFLPSTPEPERGCGHWALILLLLEEAHAQGVRELHWEPGERPRILRVRDGRLEERLEVPVAAFAEHLRALLNRATEARDGDRPSFDLTGLSAQRLEVRVALERQAAQNGTRLVVRLEPLR